VKDVINIKPAPALAGVKAYRVPRPRVTPALRLDGNEGAAPPAELLEALRVEGTRLLQRYPDAGPLEALLARRIELEPERVLVTAGADDALERACRAVLAPGRSMVLPVPTFEMMGRYARATGAEVREVPWPDGPYPTQAVLQAVTPDTAAVVVCSPNNPTGAVATRDDLLALSRGAPHALLIVDLAYVEFADQDLTATVLALPNALAVRTLSKAWGLAGLRVGYALGPAEVISWLRSAGHPYAVSGPSLTLAAERLRGGEAQVAAFVASARHARGRLAACLAESGARPLDSQGNFVLARVADARFTWEALAALGVAVRAFPGVPGLEDALRVACPESEADLARALEALRVALRPQALLLDMDGVLVDVSESYRQAIRGAARAFGVDLNDADVSAAKAEGDANNDWVVTQRLLARRGVQAELAEVRARFEELYQGTPQRPGLWRLERLIPHREWLVDLARRLPLGVVTGRPRPDAERFLRDAGLGGVFQALVTMGEAAAPKPDPAPVRLALERLGVERAWMVGDTPDDVRAARAAGVVPLAVLAPGDGPGLEEALLDAGAARVMGTLEELEELLP
jgi:histidinol-phosphate aminotransferase